MTTTPQDPHDKPQASGGPTPPHEPARDTADHASADPTPAAPVRPAAVPPAVVRPAAVPYTPAQQASVRHTPVPQTPVPPAAIPQVPDPAAGQHAAPRPYPPSGPPTGATATRPDMTPGPSRHLPPRTVARPDGSDGFAARERATAFAPRGLPQPVAPEVPDEVAPLAQTTAPTEPAAPAPAPSDAKQPARDLPEPPSRPGFGRHLVAALLGFVLTPFAMLLVGVGTSRLADIAGTSDMGTDMLGLTLLLVGIALLAAIVLLGVWSPAMPIVGGLVWGIGLGAAYLSVPGPMEDAAKAMTADGTVPASIEQLAEAAMSGNLLILGTLLLAAGLAISLARRGGRRWAERVATANRARAEAARETTPPSATGTQTVR